MKKITRRSFLQSVSAMGAASALAACSSTSTDSSAASTTTGTSTDTSTDAGPKPAVLNMFWFAEGDEVMAMEKLIEEYQTLNPHITINMLEVAYSDMTNKILMSVSGGEAPALARVTDVAPVKEATLNLYDYWDDADSFLDDYMEAVHSYVMMDDRLMAIPMDVTANGMFYNKTAFEKAGVKVPTDPDKDLWTWDEFVDALEKVMKDGGVEYGMVIDNPTHRWSTMLYQFGGHYLDGDTPDFNTPESIECIYFTKELFDNGIVPTSTWLGGEDPNNIFRAGQAAVHFAGNWMLANYCENIKDFEWGALYMPYQKRRSSVLGGKWLAAFADTGVEQESADFLKFLASKESNAQYCSESLFISPRLDNANLTYSLATEEFAVFANELANTPPDSSHDFGYPDWNATVSATQKEGMFEILVGDTTPEEHVKVIDELSQTVVG